MEIPQNPEDNKHITDGFTDEELAYLEARERAESEWGFQSESEQRFRPQLEITPNAWPESKVASPVKDNIGPIPEEVRQQFIEFYGNPHAVGHEYEDPRVTPDQAPRTAKDMLKKDHPKDIDEEYRAFTDDQTATELEATYTIPSRLDKTPEMIAQEIMMIRALRRSKHTDENPDEA